MPIYRCPNCNEWSIFWDSHCKAFICHSCGKAVGITEVELAEALSLNRVNVTQEWINSEFQTSKN